MFQRENFYLRDQGIPQENQRVLRSTQEQGLHISHYFGREVTEDISSHSGNILFYEIFSLDIYVRINNVDI